MNLTNFLSSGYLEAYVLGALEENDLTLVGKWLSYEEVQTYLAILNEDLERYSRNMAIDPPGR